jgi:hypothetical protein
VPPVPNIGPLAAFDLSDLKPIAVVVFVVAVVIIQAIAKGKKLLQDTWTEDTWLPPKSPGDFGSDREPTVIRRWVKPTAPSAPPPLPKTAGAWEQELERILRGEPANPAAPPVPVPAPPPPPRSRHGTFDHNQDSDLESAPAPSTPLATMSESAANQRRADAAYDEGASLHQQVLQRMRSVDAQVSQHTAAATHPSTARQNTATESAAVRSWLRQPDTARAAIVAAIVFGPPKALEP